MMEQGETVQDNKNEEEKEERIARKKIQLRHIAIISFALGLLFVFAPTYIQTNISWIVNMSAAISAACWVISYLCIVNAYPGLPKNANAFAAFNLACAIYLYIGSEYGKSPDPNDPYYYVKYRAISFAFLLVAVMLTVIRLPHFIDYYRKNKSKIKAFSTVKNIFAVVGAAVVFLTALFQFMQVLLQIFHR